MRINRMTTKGKKMLLSFSNILSKLIKNENVLRSALNCIRILHLKRVK